MYVTGNYNIYITVYVKDQINDFTFKFIAHFRTVIYSYMAINT